VGNDAASTWYVPTYAVAVIANDGPATYARLLSAKPHGSRKPHDGTAYARNADGSTAYAWYANVWTATLGLWIATSNVRIRSAPNARRLWVASVAYATPTTWCSNAWLTYAKYDSTNDVYSSNGAKYDSTNDVYS
jgi:hypothetical protein